ncbi:MAG: translation initiation factor IF-2 N-terminal domain-containing protein, partial [Planctomycetota bacterium]
MAVRIYAFAKDLGLENKELLDICEKLGIKGKGSALANLDDDEISKIKKFLAGESETPAAPPAVVETPPPPTPTPTVT